MRTHHILTLFALIWTGIRIYHYAMPVAAITANEYNTVAGPGSLKSAFNESSQQYPSQSYSKQDSEDKAAQQNAAALLDAAARGDTMKVESLVARRVNINTRDNERRTPLMYAVLAGHDDVIIRLVAAGANPELRDREGNNSFDYAAEHGVPDNVRLLLQRTHRQDDGHYVEYAQLMAAALASDVSQLPQGADKFASVNHVNPDGQAPLQIAAGNGAVNLMSMLIDRGADVNIASASGQTPLYWAAWNNKADAINLLVTKGANVEAHDRAGDTPLILAARNNSSDAVRILLDKGADKYHANRDGQTAYSIAQDKGYANLTAELK